MSNIIEKIHCKISYDGQIRRFALVGTEFTSLKETIARLANISSEFVLKYRDDESDYVNLENQEDLTTALMISPTFLRIAVEKTNAPPSCPLSTTDDNRNVEKTNAPPSCPPSTDDNRKRHHHDHHGHNRRDCHDHKNHHHKTSSSDESHRLRAEKKLVFINQCLSDLGSDDSKLIPRDLFKKQRLLKKQERLTTFLQGDPKQQPQHHRRERRVLTQEELQFNCKVKLQMLEIKTESAKVKAREREIKLMLQSKPRETVELKNELDALKEKKHLFKAQRKSLCDKLHV